MRLSFLRNAAIGLVLLCMGGASPSYATGGGVVNANINYLHVENGETFIFLDTTVGNPDGCADNRAIALPTTSPNYQGQLALLMTAFAAGKKVTIWVSECAPSPWAPSLPRAYAIQIIR